MNPIDRNREPSLPARLVVALVLSLALASCGRSPNGPAPGSGSEGGVAAPQLSLWSFDVLTHCSMPIIPQSRDGAVAPAFVREQELHLGETTTPSVRFSAAGSFPELRLRYEIDGVTWQERAVPCSSSAGGRVVRDVAGPAWTAPDTGSYLFVVSLDPDDRYAELDSLPNVDTIRVCVLLPVLAPGLIDLWAPGVPTIGPLDTVRVGTAVLIRAATHARGAFPDLRIVLTESGRALLDHRVRAVSGICWGFATVDTTTWIAASPGIHVFAHEVDPDGEYPRRQPIPNRRERTLVVVP